MAEKKGAVNELMDLAPSRGKRHVYKGKGMCSKRTQIASHIMEDINQAELYKQKEMERPMPKGQKNSRRKAKCRGERKVNKIGALKVVEPSLEKAVPGDMLKKGKFYFRSPTGVPIVRSYKEDVIHTIGRDCEIVDTVDGAKTMDGMGNIVFLLLPREVALEGLGNNAVGEVDMLMKLQKTGKHTERGKKTKGFSSSRDSGKYITAGVQTIRGRHGTNFGAFKGDTVRRNQLINCIKRREHLAIQYMATPELRALVLAKTLIGWKTVDEKGLIYPAIAAAVDYISAAHIDEDFFLTAFSLLVDCFEPDKDGKKKTSKAEAVDTENEKVLERKREMIIQSCGKKYLKNAPVAQYFVFPEVGKAVAMRPGDLLLYNPMHYHCCSSKEIFYNEFNVHVSSMYLKTGIVGKNDNRIMLSATQHAIHCLWKKARDEDKHSGKKRKR